MVNRRQFTTYGVAASLAAAWPPTMRSQHQPLRLRDQAARSKLLFGTPVWPQEFLEKPNYSALVAEQCSIVTNPVYMSTIHPERDRFDFTNSDIIFNFARQHGLSLRGHPLIYGLPKVLPEWFSKGSWSIDGGDGRKILTDHVTSIVSRYAGHMHSWDVVNEAIEPVHGRPDRLRQNAWLSAVGPEYIELAFRTAASVDPKAILTYNEYGIEEDGPSFDVRRTAVLELLTRLRKNGVPIGALGIQSHIIGSADGFKGTKLATFLADVASLGLRIFITEMDVADRDLPPDIALRDAAVARTYSSYLDVVLAQPAVSIVLTWGLSDYDTWLMEHTPRADGLPVRSLPFDANLRPKPAVTSMANAFDRRIL
jgi:endo-1,4-beta-xylanase